MLSVQPENVQCSPGLGDIRRGGAFLIGSSLDFRRFFVAGLADPLEDLEDLEELLLLLEDLEDDDDLDDDLEEPLE